MSWQIMHLISTRLSSVSEMLSFNIAKDIFSAGYKILERDLINKYSVVVGTSNMGSSEYIVSINITYSAHAFGPRLACAIFLDIFNNRGPQSFYALEEWDLLQIFRPFNS